MSPMVQLDMGGRALPAEFKLGPLRFTHADTFPLETMFCSTRENEITLRLSAHFSSDSPWCGGSMVVFFLYRFPGGADAFHEEVRDYREGERKSVKLPEKQPFDESVLALDDVGVTWQHDWFANSGRDLFHVYQSEYAGVMVRWFSQRGTMLDHPLLSLARDHVRLVDGQWETESPSTVQVKSSRTEENETEVAGPVLTLDLRTERQRVRRFIKQRVRDYGKRENFGPGGPGDPIRLITLGYYAEQTGYVALVFDTRPEAEVDGGWTLYIEDEFNILYVPEWCGLYMAACDGQTATLTAHDGSEHAIVDGNISEEDLNAFFGQMLTALMQELREVGMLSKLPLAAEAYIVVEEFDGRYGWRE